MLWVSGGMGRTGVADGDDFVGDGVLTVGGTGIDAVDVIYAAADGVFLDDANTHGMQDWRAAAIGGDDEKAKEGNRAGLGYMHVCTYESRADTEQKRRTARRERGRVPKEWKDVRAKQRDCRAGDDGCSAAREREGEPRSYHKSAAAAAAEGVDEAYDGRTREGKVAAEVKGRRCLGRGRSNWMACPSHGRADMFTLERCEEQLTRTTGRAGASRQRATVGAGPAAASRRRLDAVHWTARTGLWTGQWTGGRATGDGRIALCEPGRDCLQSGGCCAAATYSGRLLLWTRGVGCHASAG